MFIFVYKTTNKKNGKYYIGVHQTDDINDGYLGSGIALNKAINIYGRGCFKREIIEYFDDLEEAYDYECKIVTEEVINDPSCYNMKIGGVGGWDHVDNYGENNPMKDKNVVWRCIDSAWFTKNQNKEYYDKIAISNLEKAIEKNTGKPRSEKDKEKIRYGLMKYYNDHESPIKGRVQSIEEREMRSNLWDEEKRLNKSEEMKKRIVNEDIDMGRLSRGKPKNEDTKKKMSESRKKWWEENKKPIECPHCSKIGYSKGNMNRWHFDNCKERK